MSQQKQDEIAAELARLTADNDALRAQAAASDARVADVELRYITLWRAVSEAANVMLSVNHPPI